MSTPYGGVFCENTLHAHFYKQRFLSTQPQCCLTFSWIEIQMLLRCCLRDIAIIILRQILHLVYLCPCLSLSLFMLYLCDLCFIFSLIFMIINHITLLKQVYLIFVHFLEYLVLFLDDNINEESEKFSNSISSAPGCCLAFAWFFLHFQPGVAYKIVAYRKKKACNPFIDNVPKRSNTLWKSCNIPCKIFKVCLTILGRYALKS